jgi:hypothetical protein
MPFVNELNLHFNLVSSCVLIFTSHYYIFYYMLFRCNSIQDVYLILYDFNITHRKTILGSFSHF